jgi:glutamate-1-semialdehyde 2,1-aminomutase
MLERGVYLPPSPFEAWFPSLAHDDGGLDATLAAAAEAFTEMSDERCGVAERVPNRSSPS